MSQSIFTSTQAVLIQGITGKEGQKSLAWMRKAGTNVLAGVTPGKGGQIVEDVPVYNSVAEALSAHPTITTSSMSVPPQFAKAAALEAITAGIQFLHIFAEGIPTQDTASILAAAQKHSVRIIGPSSIGYSIPGLGKIGVIGGATNEQFLATLSGNSQQGVAIISKSGGMASEMATLLTSLKIPQRFIVGIGGDRLIGTTYADLLPDLAADEQTGAVVIIGEIGGSYEEELAAQITKLKFSKPVIAYISGLFAETLPSGVSFGHAGAIVSKTYGTRAGKIAALKAAGVQVVNSPEEIAEKLTTQFN